MAALVLMALASFMGSFFQSGIGFGGGVCMMSIIPFVINPAKANIICQLTSVFLTISILFRVFKSIRKDILIPFLLPSVIVNIFAASYATKVDVETMRLYLGVFFVLLSIYFLAFSKKIQLKTSLLSNLSMGMLTGLFSGLFSLAGPTAALYLSSAIEEKDEFIATSQIYYLVLSSVSLVVRISKTALDKTDLAHLVFCLSFVLVGTLTGAVFSRKLAAESMKRLIYFFIGLNGLIVVIQHFL